MICSRPPATQTRRDKNVTMRWQRISLQPRLTWWQFVALLQISRLTTALGSHLAMVGIASLPGLAASNNARYESGLYVGTGTRFFWDHTRVLFVSNLIPFNGFSMVHEWQTDRPRSDNICPNRRCFQWCRLIILQSSEEIINWRDVTVDSVFTDHVTVDAKHQISRVLRLVSHNFPFWKFLDLI